MDFLKSRAAPCGSAKESIIRTDEGNDGVHGEKGSDVCESSGCELICGSSNHALTC